MRLTIVGCGTAAPDPERVAASFFLEVAGLKLLMDCGPGALHHLARFGLEWPRITHLLITHFHNDHVGDVPALFFAWRWGMMPARSAPLHVLAPRGMARKLKHMANAMGQHVREPGFAVTVDELVGEEHRLLGDVVHVKTLRTPHTAESIAFRIDTPDGSVGYTGDTGYSEQLSAFLSRVDLLIMECSLPDELAMDTHLTPSSAARMAQQANPGALVLTHAYPQLDRRTLADVVASCGWTGDTVIAEDGMIIE
ncbi:MAG TPA: MBL fold metallo-hydrolase [Longimicrobiales bacterium]